LVEHCTENAGVGGSIPPLGTITFQIWQCGAFRDFVPLAKKWDTENPSFCSARSRWKTCATAVRVDLKNFRVTSAVGDIGRENGHGNIDAIDPKRTSPRFPA
jgi:hypothetical protein